MFMKSDLGISGNFRDIVVIGASAGGVEALTQLMKALPSDLPAAVFVVLHISDHGTSVLPSILSRAGNLPARHPEDGEQIQHGVVYVAPSDRHLLIENDHISVLRGPRENGHRPSVDPLFRTAARTAGKRVIGIILSGLLDDGTAGLMAIKRFGGIAMVQSPDEALFSGMVQSAIANVRVDYVLPVAEIAAEISRLTREPLPKEPSSVKLDTTSPGVAPGQGRTSMDDEVDSDIAAERMDPEIIDSSTHPGKPSAFSCPECGGVLWEIQDGAMVRFRCRTGHAYSSDTLLAEQSHELDVALWSALRALEESASLARRLRDRSTDNGHPLAAARFAEQSEEALKKAAIIRRALLRNDPVSESPETPPH